MPLCFKSSTENGTCLIYFRARYYDPQTGEFISRDPLGYVDGMSQYRAYFVPGSMDPMGLFEISEVLNYYADHYSQDAALKLFFLIASEADGGAGWRIEKKCHWFNDYR